MFASLESETLDVEVFRDELATTGCVMFPSYSLFSADELTEMDHLCGLLPHEKIILGDAGESNNLYVGRFMVDRAGEAPTLVNRPHSDRLLEILSQSKAAAFFGRLLDHPHFIRRCQINRMTEGSFVGVHLDTDSNPDYVVSVVVQLGKDFGNGEFVVHRDDGSLAVFKPDYGSVIVARCDKAHEVKTVTSNERCSLVYFYSREDGLNRRI